MEHSKLPFEAINETGSIVIYSSDSEIVGVLDTDSGLNKEDADFIITACNEYDTLKAKAELLDDIATSLKRHWQHCQLSEDDCRICQMHRTAKELSK